MRIWRVTTNACMAFAIGVSSSSIAQPASPAAMSAEDATSTAPAMSTQGVYRSYVEAAASHPGMLISLDFIVGGYALPPPLQGPERAMAKAVEAGQKRGAQNLVLIDQRDVFVSTPPPGYLVTGKYSSVKLASVNFVEATPERVMAELQRSLFSEAVAFYPVVANHMQGLLQRCQSPAFASTSEGLSALLRDPRADHLPLVLASDLVDAIAAHPSPELTDTSSAGAGITAIPASA